MVWGNILETHADGNAESNSILDRACLTFAVPDLFLKEMKYVLKQRPYKESCSSGVSCPHNRIFLDKFSLLLV